MEILSVQNLSFQYAQAQEKSLDQISFNIKEGDFVLLCGGSGSGKSTLLSLIKHDIAPHGQKEGSIQFFNQPIASYQAAERSQHIAMVFQHPDDQIVMDSVEDELVFAMENLAFPMEEMRKKVAEIASYFSLDRLFKQPVDSLSGGQKQLLNLASVLILDPSLILLDEPTSQLDPIAAADFISLLEQINKNFGVSILIAEHRLDQLYDIADQVVVLENGKLAYDQSPQRLCQSVSTDEAIYHYLPVASRLYLSFEEEFVGKQCPLNVRQARQLLTSTDKLIFNHSQPKQPPSTPWLLKMKEIDFQFDPTADLILDNLSLQIHQEKIHTIMGANGSGKTTLLKVMANMLKAQHGKIKINKNSHKQALALSYLPQNPALVFIEDSLMGEYQNLCQQYDLADSDERINEWLDFFDLSSYKHRHPYDLSGGQLQKAALITCLLNQPDLLLMDEPTKGLDPLAKRNLARLMIQLKEKGITIVMVSHDVEFSSVVSDELSLLFDGQITVSENRRSFFKNNMYYTTQMSRISRKTPLADTLTLEEAVSGWEFLDNSSPIASS